MSQVRLGLQTAQPAPEMSVSAYRWVILAVTWTSYVITYIDRLAWSNIATVAAPSLGLTIATLGGLITAFYIGYVLSNVLCGFLSDLLGGGRMLTYALIPLGLLTFAFSYTQSLWYALVVQGFMGLAAGADYSASITILARWFPVRSRARAMGLFISGTSIGVILTNAMIPALLESFDWRTIYQGLGVVTVVFGISCLFTLKGRVKSEADGRGKPTIKLLVRNRDLAFIALAGFGGYWGAWGFAFWASALMIKGHHLTGIQAGAVLAIFGIAAAVSKPIMGLISDFLNGARKLPTLCCLVAFSAMLIIFGRMGSYHAFLFTAPILGLFAFAYTPPLAALISEVVGPSLTGSATGLTNAIWQLGNVIVPLVIGTTFAYTGSFYAAFIGLAAGPALGAFAMIFVHDTRKPPHAK